MNTFMEKFSQVASQLLPVVGVVVLVCVIILLIKLIKILGNVNTTVDRTNRTIDLVDESIEKVQAPLDTVVKVSHTVDKAHDVTVSAVGTAKDFVVKTATDAKNKLTTYFESDDSKVKETSDTNDDEIVKGE